MRVPIITNVYPSKIFNLVVIKHVQVSGRDFINSEGLVCLFGNRQKVKAVFDTQNKVLCSLKDITNLGASTS